MLNPFWRRYCKLLDIDYSTSYDYYEDSKMKIALVDLGSPPRVEINEPLGIESLLGNLLSHFGDKVEGKLYSTQIIEKISVEELLCNDVIGFSISIGSYDLLDEYINDLLNHWGKADLPIILLGGSIATFAAKELLGKYPFVICVRGEGESSLNRIIDILIKLDKKHEITTVEELHKVPNLSFINSEGTLEETDSVIEDLSALNIPSRLLLPEIIQHRGIARAEASRGCPFGRCKFCAVASKYGDALWRPIPIDRVVEDLKVISDIGALSVYFSDDDFFGTSLERINSLCEFIVNEKSRKTINPNLNFFVSTRINSVLGEKLGGINKSKETLKRMKIAGFREIFLGIESGSKEQIRRYGKGTTNDKSIQAINLIKSQDISIDIGFIMFDKFIDIPQLQANIEFLKIANLFDHEANLLKILRIQPQTPIEDEFLSEGLITHNSLDINNLKYDYEFEDTNVRWVYKLYQEWEKPMKPIYYQVQAASRGEVPSENIRSKLKWVLGSLRKVDMTFLERCISYASAASNSVMKSYTDNPLETNDLADEREKLKVLAEQYLKEYYCE